MSDKNLVTSSTENTEVAVGGYSGVTSLGFLEEGMDDCQGLEFSFDRIKIPAGGSTAFEVPGESEDNVEMVKEITGVILYNHPAFSYYTEKYTGGNNPPECGSFDGVTGHGNPGGSCSSCPYNQFGSGDGQSKACKNRRMLYILQEGELFPQILSLPTGSLKEFTKYVKRQLSKGRRLNQIVTKISLKKATSSSGITFSQAVFAFDRNLNEAEKAAVTGLTEQVKSYAANYNAAALIGGDDVPFVDAETGEVVAPLN